MCQSTRVYDVLCNGRDDVAQHARGRLLHSLGVHFDYSAETQCHVEHANPRLLFVFNVSDRHSPVGVHSHEQAACSKEGCYVGLIRRDQCLNRCVRADVTKIREHRHEAFAFEWEGVHVDNGEVCAGIWLDHLVGDLIGEEGDYKVVESIDDAIISHEVGGYGWDSEKLESEVLH